MQPDGGWRAQAKVPGDWDSILLWLDPALAGSDFTRIKSGPQGDSMAARYECNHNSKFLIVVYRKDREDYNLAMAYAGR